MKRTRRPHEDIDAELYSTSVLEELMESGEWRKVDEVVQLALRAVADALSTHAQSLTDLKALLTTRVNQALCRPQRQSSPQDSPSKLIRPMSARPSRSFRGPWRKDPPIRKFRAC